MAVFFALLFGCLLLVSVGLHLHALRTQAALLAEVIVQRQQIAVLSRHAPKRLRIPTWRRLVMGWLCHVWPRLLDTVKIVKPATVIGWHRAGFRLYWRRKSRHRGGRPQIDPELIARIRALSRENPLWGAPHIHGELLRIGYVVAESTVAKYMAWRAGDGGQAWTTFLRNHAKQIVAIDMLTVPTISFQQLKIFVVLGLGRRKILHVEVTDHATAPWLANQITEAFPWDTAPRFLVRDNDGAFGLVFRRRLSAMGIRDSPITPHSPWQNAYVERVNGSIRRECLDHIIPLGAAHLRRVLREYVDYYNNDRTHLALGKDAPNSRPMEADGAIVSRPVLGGLHHRYRRIPSK